MHLTTNMRHNVQVQRDSGGIIAGGSAGTTGWAWRTGGNMSFADWRKRTTTFDRYLSSGYHAMAELVAKAAYRAGERQGRKDAEEMARRAIALRETLIALSQVADRDT